MLGSSLMMLTVLLAGLLAAGALLTVAPGVLAKQRLKRELMRRSRGRLVLTYDDGPGPLMTPPLLQVLRKHGAKASFYLVGWRAERYPQTCDLMAAEGHDLGAHSHWHRNPWRTWPWTPVRDQHRGYETLKRWVPDAAPYRPPFGKLTTWTHRAARRSNRAVSFWTFDGLDTAAALPNAETIARDFVNAGGGVVLLHSHDRGAERQAYVLALTERLLAVAHAQGFRVCTMSELLNERSASA